MALVITFFFFFKQLTRHGKTLHSLTGEQKVDYGGARSFYGYSDTVFPQANFK